MNSYTYRHPRPAVSADSAVLAWDGQTPQILLVQRANPPFQHTWALPGGFVDMDENLKEAALRELREETGLICSEATQIQAFGAVDRDPRTRVITVAWLVLMPLEQQEPEAASDAAAVRWFPLRQLPELAFDHRQIIDTARRQLKLRLRCQPFGREWLPDEFPLKQLQKAYEAVLGESIDARAFRRVLERHELLLPGRDDPTRFRFSASRYDVLMEQGLDFPAF